MSPEEELANAIVLQAAKDYRSALRRLAQRRRNGSAEMVKAECERFFRSQWYEFLTDVDGEYLIRKLNEEAGIMKTKEYLKQYHRLDQRIEDDLADLEQFQEKSRGISSPGFEGHYNASKNTEAPFVHYVEKSIMMEQSLGEEIDRLMDLKVQIKAAINTVADQNERMVLKYRYIDCITWGQIGKKMSADVSTVRRWHDRALSHVEMPETPIQI